MTCERRAANPSCTSRPTNLLTPRAPSQNFIIGHEPLYNKQFILLRRSGPTTTTTTTTTTIVPVIIIIATTTKTATTASLGVMTNDTRRGGYLRFPLQLSGSCAFEIRDSTTDDRSSCSLSCHAQLAFLTHHLVINFSSETKSPNQHQPYLVDIAANNFDYHQTSLIFAKKRQQRVVTMSREHAFIIRSRDKLRRYKNSNGRALTPTHEEEPKPASGETGPGKKQRHRKPHARASQGGSLGPLPCWCPFVGYHSAVFCVLERPPRRRVLLVRGYRARSRIDSHRGPVQASAFQGSKASVMEQSSLVKSASQLNQIEDHK